MVHQKVRFELIMVQNHSLSELKSKTLHANGYQKGWIWENNGHVKVMSSSDSVFAHHTGTTVTFCTREC